MSLRDTLAKWGGPRRFSVVPLPDVLNPLPTDHISIYAALGYELELQNVKSRTALGLCLGARERNLHLEGATLIEATSGNTGYGLAVIATTLFGVRRVITVTRGEIPESKKTALLLAGAEVLFPPHDSNPFAFAKQLAAENGYLHLNQYGNESNPDIHETLTGKNIFEACPDANLLAFGVGTGGTMIGCARFFRNIKSKVGILGVICAKDQEVPGVRDRKQLERDVTLPWKETADFIVEMHAAPSYLAAMWLLRAARIPSGPSGGFCLAGLYRHLITRKALGTLDELRDREGKITAVVFIADTCHPYSERFTGKIHQDHFTSSNPPKPWEIAPF